MTLYVENHRKDGPFAIETHCECKRDWRSGHFEKVSCVVIYGDKDQPSHSVRIFKWRDES